MVKKQKPGAPTVEGSKYNMSEKDADMMSMMLGMLGMGSSQTHNFMEKISRGPSETSTKLFMNNGTLYHDVTNKRALFDPATKKDEGNALVKQGKYEEAIVKYNEALNEGKKDTGLREAVLSNMALCYLSLKNWTMCLSVANEALELNPSNSKSLYRRGVAHRNLGYADMAVTDLRAAAAISPYDVSISDELAEVERLGLIPVTIDFEHPPLTMQVPSEVWQFVSAWLPPKQKFDLAMHHFAIYSTKGKCILETIKAKSGLKTMAALVADVWQYNEPELQDVLGEIQSLSLDLTSYRLSAGGSKVVGDLKRVLTEYNKGLDLPLWKYLPRGLRCNYDKYFEPLPRQTIVRYDTPVSRQTNPAKKFSDAPVAFDITVPPETRKYHTALTGSTTSDAFAEVFEFSRDNLIVIYPHDFDSAMRIVEVNTGLAADVKLAYLQCWPSKRCFFMGKSMWLAGSMKPIKVVYPDTHHEIETFTAVFNPDRIDFSCIIGCFSIDCRIDHNNVESVNLKRIDEPKLAIASELSVVYPHECHLTYVTKKGGYRLLSRATPVLMQTVIQAIADFRPSHPANDVIIAERKAKNLPPLAKNDLPYGYDRIHNSTHDFLCSITDAVQATNYELTLSQIQKLVRGRRYEDRDNLRRYVQDVISGKIVWRS